MRNKKRIIYSIDIGGSSIKHGIVEVEGAKCTIVTRMPTIMLHNRLFATVKDHILLIVGAYAKQARGQIDVAFSTTGGVSKSGLVWNAGHFVGYKNVDWRVILSAHLSNKVRHVTTVNDGKASTWAEYHKTGLGTEVFVNFVVGSGVGGGIVVADNLLYGDDETAGALGHMKVGGDSPVSCSCGHQNCVETLASSAAIVRYFAKLQNPTARTSKWTFEDTVQAAMDGNANAIRSFEIAGEWLGVAISNIINILNPRFITIGGGVNLASLEISSRNGGPFLASAIRRARKLAFTDVARATQIKSSTVGNDGGLLGAALICSAAMREKERL